MRPTVSQYAQVLMELSEGKEALTGAVIAKNFFEWLKQRGEEKKLPLIVERLEKMEMEKAEELSVTVVTAHEISKETEALLLKKAQKLFPGKKILLHHEIDESIIGGAEFRTDETLYDATIRAELDSLKKSLLKA